MTSLRLSRVLIVLIAVFSLLPLIGCEDKITSESFDQIKVGMQLHEVETILGGKGDPVARGGTDISSGGIASGNAATQQLYEWRKGNKLISVTCVDGKVVDKGKNGV
jgi:hypothetical protein